MPGIGAGETLKIVWPSSTQTASGPDEHSCEPLAIFAMLFLAKLADAAMGRAHGERSYPWPSVGIAALEREIDELSHVEEALIEAAIARGENVRRSQSALPQAVLGVRIVERISRSHKSPAPEPRPGRSHSAGVFQSRRNQQPPSAGHCEAGSVSIMRLTSRHRHH